jgi:hypothetical protein
LKRVQEILGVQRLRSNQMATEAGARLVEELLYRIDEGMAAEVILWRISNHLSLAGDGGLRASGR